MITQDSRQILILATQHEVRKIKDDYRAGRATIEELRAVSKAMEAIQQQVVIEASKN